MPYTIKIHGFPDDAVRLRAKLSRAIAEDGRFTATLGPVEAMTRGAKEGSRKVGHGFTVTRVRLTAAKPYCGQHPGECLAGGPKMKAKYLEWDDWVAFHALVNTTLGETDADVWSRPVDAVGIMWIRKGIKARQRYDYDEECGAYGREVRVWNRGTADQFEDESCDS